IQMTLAVVLIAGASLLIRTLVNLANVDAGFARQGVVVAPIDFEELAPNADRLAIEQRLLEAVRRLPGVEFATIGAMTPLNGTEEGRPVSVPGSIAPTVEDQNMPPVLGAPT